LILILCWRSGNGGRRRNRGICGVQGRIDMTIHWSKRGRKQNRADHDKNHRIGIAEVEVAAAHLLEEEEDADGDDDRGSQERANRASRATASWIVAHLCSLLRCCS